MAPKLWARLGFQASSCVFSGCPRFDEQGSQTAPPMCHPHAHVEGDSRLEPFDTEELLGWLGAARQSSFPPVSRFLGGGGVVGGTLGNATHEAVMRPLFLLFLVLMLDPDLKALSGHSDRIVSSLARFQEALGCRTLLQFNGKATLQLPNRVCVIDIQCAGSCW